MYKLLRICLLISLLPAVTAHAGPDPGNDGQQSGTTVVAPTVIWKVVSSGGTQATLGTDKYLFGTVIQTAIGEVTSSNYTIRQGFWQDFAEPCLGGDADGNGMVSIGDAVYIVNFIFGGGDPPVTACGGDFDGNGYVTIGDAVAIVMGIFAP
jgi:hypothetical protein